MQPQRGAIARSLGVDACAGTVSVDGERILFAHRTPLRWAVTDLAGATPTDVADRHYEPVFLGADGLVRLTGPACEGASHITFVSVDRLVQRGPDPVRPCTLRYPRRSVSVDRRGNLQIAYRCPAGCEGRMRLYLHGTRRVVSLRTQNGSISASTPIPDG